MRREDVPRLRLSREEVTLLESVRRPEESLSACLKRVVREAVLGPKGAAQGQSGVGDASLKADLAASEKELRGLVTQVLERQERLEALLKAGCPKQPRVALTDPSEGSGDIGWAERMAMDLGEER